MTANITKGYFQRVLGFKATTRVGMPRLKHLLSLQRQRRDLGSLEGHLLRDIGVSQHEADIEASRRIWDVPASWKI